MDYVNVPRLFAVIVSKGLASFHELDTYYGLEDVYDMIEIIAVDSHNHSLTPKA